MDGLLLALFLIKCIIFCIFPSGSCLWEFLRWQIPENLPFLYWKLWRDLVCSSSQDLFSFWWFRSISITLVLMHSNAHSLRTIVHSFLIVKVLSTSILFQKICGRESLERALSSYLYAYASGSVTVGWWPLYLGLVLSWPCEFTVVTQKLPKKLPVKALVNRSLLQFCCGVSSALMAFDEIGTWTRAVVTPFSNKDWQLAGFLMAFSLCICCHFYH